MPYEPLESKRMYQRAEAVSDRVWEIVTQWEWFARRTVGVQLVDSTDSIGSNIAEAGGRFHPADVRNFLYYARGSLYETRFRLRRAVKRSLLREEDFTWLCAELEQLAREINESINFQKTRKTNK